jgi:hypothetical protein
MDKKYYQVEYKSNVIIPPDARKAIVAGFEAKQIKYDENMIKDAYLSTKEK